MSQHEARTQDPSETTARSSGWWGRFVALLAGAPPFAVWADQQGDDDDEPRPADERD